MNFSVVWRSDWNSKWDVPLRDTPNDEDLKQVDLRSSQAQLDQEYHKTVQPNLIMTNSDHECFSLVCGLTIDLSCMQQVKEPN